MKSPIKLSINRLGQLSRGVILLATLFLLSPKPQPCPQGVSVLTQHNDLFAHPQRQHFGNHLDARATSKRLAFAKLFANNIGRPVIYAQPLLRGELETSLTGRTMWFLSAQKATVSMRSMRIRPAITYWHVKLERALHAILRRFVADRRHRRGTPVSRSAAAARSMWIRNWRRGQLGVSCMRWISQPAPRNSGGPVTISATDFTASLEHQRPGLLFAQRRGLSRPGSHCDSGAYHGFVLGYNATNLTQLYSFNVTPTGYHAGAVLVWRHGAYR